MKKRKSEELTVKLGGGLDRLKVLRIVMNKMMSILDEMLSENEELMRKKQENIKCSCKSTGCKHKILNLT
jgi:hypothetical protein